MACTIIAECCQNHNGSREILKRMVHEAAESGADYAKIQALRSTELSQRERFENGITDTDGTVRAIKRPYEAERERLAKLDLSDADELWFADECKRAGVKSMITAFTRFSTQRFVAAGFDAVKVASYDCKSVALLQEVAANFKTVYISTGATLDEEISTASKIFVRGQASFLHCVTIYPTPLDQLHLNRMAWMKQFSNQVGFSDHTAPASTDLRASKLAITLGADVLERHFTILEPHETRDGAVSATPKQMQELRDFSLLSVDERKAKLDHEWPEWQIGLGQDIRPLSPTELLNRDYYAGRVAAWVDGEQVSNI
ncbi:MAG: general stress protein [Actinobacteria bacterium]|nr:general stress protein [Actinomycetota bacterium]